MKRFAVALAVLLISSQLWAGRYNDLSFSLGLDQFDFNNGISFSYGANLGLTSRLELDIWGISELIDKPFFENILGAELCFSIIGNRNTGSKIAGSGINTIVGLGAFYDTESEGVGPFFSITPLCIGSPITGKRERILRTGFGWDVKNESLLVTFSLVNIDIYAKGTYRDYEF